MSVQCNMRKMMCAEDIRLVGFHGLFNSLDIECVEFFVTRFNVWNASILPVIPWKQLIIFMTAHAAVEKMTSSDN